MAAIQRTQTGLIALAMGALAVGVVLPTPGEAAPVCRTSTIAWTAPTTVLLYRGGPVTYDTGLSVPAAGPGETVSVSASVYGSYDRYPANASPSRADADQQHEQWGLRIGGVNFGLLTADVPDSVDEGAVDNWYASTAGTLGVGAVTTGRIVIVHSSLYGFTESYNSVRPGSFSLTVSYCSESPTSTTAPATTTTTAVTSTTGPSTSTTSATSTTTAPTTTAAGGTTTVPRTTTTEPPSQTAAPTTSTTPVTTTIVGSATTVAGSTTTTDPTTTGPTTTDSGTTTTGPTTTGPTTTGPTTTDSGTTTSILPLTPLPAATTTVVTSTTSAGGSTTVVPSGPLPSTGWNGAILLRVGTILVAVGAVLYRLRRRALAAG